MAKRLFAITLIVFSLVGIYKLLSPSQPRALEKINTKIGNSVYELEVARTTEERAVGLSNRTTLCSTCGMLFIFKDIGFYPFWMKDTQIPLDIIWLDKNYIIVDIHTAEPQIGANTWELRTYHNKAPAMYVVELNKGDFEKNNLKIGDRISLNL